MSGSYSSLQGSIFIQPGGPNTPVYYLGNCHKITNLTWNRGTNTQHWCADPVQPDKFKLDRKIKGTPGLATYNIESQISEVISYIEALDCEVPLIITETKREPKNDDTNWDRCIILPNSDNVQRDFANLVGTDTNDPVMRTTGMEADEVIELVRLKPGRDSGVTETEAFNIIFSCDNLSCASDASQRNNRCDTFYAAGDAVASSAAGKAKLWKNVNGVWTETTTAPFDTDEDISSGACFALDRDTTRIILTCGTTDAGAAAKVGISDDDGETWTTVTVGATLGEFIPGPKCLHVIDRAHMWLTTNLGRILFSADGGESWTVQENAAITSVAYNWIKMKDVANGFAGGAGDVIVSTADGGQTWTQLTATGNGGDILCGDVIDPLRAWVGTDDGETFYTLDGGATWAERAGWAGSGVGQVKDMAFYGDQVGFMIVNNGDPKGTFYMTKSGGANWETIATSANNGFNSLMMCSTRLLYAVGEAYSSVAAVFKVQPQYTI